MASSKKSKRNRELPKKIRKRAINAPHKKEQKGSKGAGMRYGKPMERSDGGERAKTTSNFSHIKNKMKRAELIGIEHTKKKTERSLKRREKLAARERGEEVEDGYTRTIEKHRDADETIVPSDDEEVEADEGMDEFKTYFDGSTAPKIMMTTVVNPSGHLFKFLKELKYVIPNCYYYKRGKYALKKIIEYATNKKFTDLIVFTEKGGKPHGMYVVHLPSGPTSYWRLSSLKLGQEIAGGASLQVDLEPELIMNNFTTRLGHRAGRQLAALFPQRPNFRGRRVITFHNQRDFVFFRHHRYAFRKEGEKAILQEIGPRFTLKMRYMQHGTFDSKFGEYEWVWKPGEQVRRTKMFI